ncbi:MAG: hypothetical protein ACJ764_03970 [Solirubrobacteraceae bacterium]
MLVSAPRYRLISLAVSLIIFAIVYFTVIKPSTDTANNAIRAGEQQVQQAIHHAKASGANVPAGVSNLTDCLAAAGSDTAKLQACAAKFQP